MFSNWIETVLKSQCSKAQGKVAAGWTPKMINAATINSGKKEQVKNSSKEPPQKKSWYSEIYNDSSDRDASVPETSDEEWNDEDEDEVQKAMLLELWKDVSDPEKESVVKETWYGAIYSKPSNNKKKTLVIGRAIRFFRDDKDGSIIHLWLDSLKHHVGNWDIVDGFPAGSEVDKYPY